MGTDRCAAPSKLVTEEGEDANTDTPRSVCPGGSDQHPLLGEDARLGPIRQDHAPAFQAGTDARVSVFPKPKSPVEALLDRGPDSSEARVGASITRLLERIRPVVRALDAAGLGSPQPGVLTTPEPRPRP